jgi:hypothetical protein
MTTLDSDTVVHDLLSRLRPETKATWGRMNAHQMVCHLTDSFGFAMGVKTASEDITFLSRTLVRWFTLHTSLRWPKSVPTRPELDQVRGGTPPVEFARDADALAGVIQKFACKPRSYSFAGAPRFSEN